MNRLLLAILSITGISFWFFLGFPLANHNESYTWVTELSRLSLSDVLTRPMKDVSAFRPVVQAAAWLGFRLSGGSIYLTQVFNYTLAAAAWLVLFMHVKEKRVFSLVALAVGGLFFSGYLYLFHLHGVCYSLMPVAVSLMLVMHRDIWDRHRFLVVSGVTLAASTFHPLALVIYIAFCAGLLAEWHKEMSGKQKALVAVCTLTAVALFIAMTLKTAQGTSLDRTNSLISFRMIELNTVLSVAALLLSILTVLSIDLSPRGRIFLAITAIVLSAVLFKAGIPLIMLWIVACLIKTILRRRWTLASLIVVTTLLPLIPGSGSPTHAIFVLISCAYVLSLGWTALESRLSFLNPAAALLLVFICAVLLGLRSGAHIPIASGLANPILAEKEKTLQMEDIIRWMINSQYRNYRLDLNQLAVSPSQSDNSIDRRHRPPTQQGHLDTYVNAMRNGEPSGDGRLVVCFGDETVEGARAVYRVKGRYAGSAAVFLPY